MTAALVFDPFNLVKHGGTSHDQASHGNRGNRTNVHGGTEEDYRGGHQPDPEGPPAHDLLDESGDWSLPRDVYDRPDLYTGYTERRFIDETVAALRSVRGKPDALVTIYRAAPAGEIETGNWITLSRSYAEEHKAMQPTDPNAYWSVLEAQVPARLVRHAGDDLMEWGYWGDTIEAVRKFFRPVAKHKGPGLHPNGTSQGVHAGKGGGWRPSMTRLEAEEWAADSAIKRPLTHTSAVFNDYELSPIETDGFQPSGAGVFGPGIYLGAEPLEAREERTVSDEVFYDANGERRDVVADRGTYLTDRQAAEYAYGSPKEMSGTRRVMVNVRKPLHVVATTQTYDGTLAIERSLEDAGHDVAGWASTTTDGTGIDRMVQHFGYDAVVVEHDGPFEWNVGGDQVIVYDPKKVTVISDDDYRYRKAVGLVDIAKHKGPGNHPNGTPQTVHGGGGGSVSAPAAPTRRTRHPRFGTMECNTVEEAQERLQAVFPNARITAGASIERDGYLGKPMGGAVAGLEKMAAEFPEAAAEVTLINFSGTATESNGEVRFNKLYPYNDYNAEPVFGLGIYINSRKNGYGGDLSRIQDALDDGARPFTAGNHEDLARFNHDIAVHEFGHVVHSTAMRKVTGDAYFHGSGPKSEWDQNQRLWEDQFGPDRRILDRTQYVSPPQVAPYLRTNYDRSVYSNPRVQLWAGGLDLPRVPVEEQERLDGPELTYVPDAWPQAPAAQVSDYALTNRAELFAESFTVRHGIGDPRYPRTVPSVIEYVVADIEEASHG